MANALQLETSPYLLQHADNPVDWHPWNDAALTLARTADKPILLSIGYSACHWCHVMAHESFEDEATAAVMNDLFVNIKVDREERPDLDRIYQLAQQMVTGRPGGWPLTMFLTPDDHIPIFAGTYFPKEANHGMPAFRDVLTRVESYYRTHRDEITDSGRRLLDAFRQMETAAASATELTSEPVRNARARLSDLFDAEHGGFGSAPKFPHPTSLDLLLDLWQRSVSEGTEDTGARHMLEKTLDAMALGGLYDHLGGGFFRYCVDRHWDIPHFEKMLYDNAALLGTYSDACAATGNRLYGRVAHETADWVLRDMQDPRGGFYATLDADADGEEGLFYVFDRDEVDELLDEPEARIAKRIWGLDAPANFEGRHWHLQVRSLEPSVLSALPADESDALGRARRRLLEARESRVRPGRDEKLLVAWNGLMIAALARASRRLGRADLGHAAERAADFIRSELWADGRLNATYKDGRARFAGYLDDYAFLAHGLIELLQTRFRVADLHFATALADVLLEHFADPAGGYFFTADDHERLIHRPKPLADEAIPAGNGIAALALDSLGHLLGEPRYLQMAAGTIRAAGGSIARHPDAHPTLLRALERQLEPPTIVIVRGDADALTAWQTPLESHFDPGRLAFFVPNDLPDLPGLIGACSAGPGPRAYICTGTQCSAPIEDYDEYLARLTIGDQEGDQ